MILFPFLELSLASHCLRHQRCINVLAWHTKSVPLDFMVLHPASLPLEHQGSPSLFCSDINPHTGEPLISVWGLAGAVSLSLASSLPSALPTALLGPQWSLPMAWGLPQYQKWDIEVASMAVLYKESMVEPTSKSSLQSEGPKKKW